MYKIKHQDIYKGHFQSGFSRYIIESIIQGYTPADVYVDKLESPRITIIWDGEHSIFCGGSADKEAMQKGVAFIRQDILTPQARQHSGIVKIMYDKELWKEVLMEGLQELGPNVYNRSIYRHKLLEVPELVCKDTDITFRRIDKWMLYESGLNDVQGVIDEVAHMWGSAEKFLENGFGYCAVKDNNIAAWCTCEYLSRASCGIGIETFEQYQRQGVAAAATGKMLNYCKVMGKTPYWDCWKNNIASARTAEKAGFEKLADYDIVFLRFV